MSRDIRILQGDCLELLRTMPDASVDSIVTDPPYGLAFMGKRWDYDVPSVDIWQECLRVLKPGGHLLAFAGTRTQHRMAVRIEDAGFEIRDMIAWVYGSGFPKSHDVSKAIDKAAGAEREVVGQGSNASRRPNPIRTGSAFSDDACVWGQGDPITAPATEAARQWQGWGSALKPSHEPITVARKPLDGTIADNVLRYGTGGINVDGCRVPCNWLEERGETWLRSGNNSQAMTEKNYMGRNGAESGSCADRVSNLGRWPANLIHDGSDEVVGLFPQTTSGILSPYHKLKASENRSMSGPNQGRNPRKEFGNDTGSAARFFYCAKTSPSERGEGNNHPTVKPLALMRYLCRLVTPPGGTVLDPFAGSGSTLLAARAEGFGAVGCELQAEYVQTIKRRLDLPDEVEETVQPVLNGHTKTDKKAKQQQLSLLL